MASYRCMVPIKRTLTNFSISEDEADVYLALLKLGTSTVTEIAKKIQRNRTATYFHVNKLVTKNLIFESRQGRLLKFTAVPPAELAARFDRLTTDFKSLVPQLEALKKIEVETPRVEVAESRAGYFKIYDEISSLPEGSTFFAIEGVEALQSEFTLLTNEEARIFYSRIIERQIETKLIITEEGVQIPKERLTKENLELLKKRKLDARTHPESILPFQGLSLLYGNTVAYLFPKTNLVMTIRHQGIADSFTAVFDALFMLGKKYNYNE